MKKFGLDFLKSFLKISYFSQNLLSIALCIKNETKIDKNKDKPSWEDCAELDPADYGAKDLSCKKTSCSLVCPKGYFI